MRSLTRLFSVVALGGGFLLGWFAHAGVADAQTQVKAAQEAAAAMGLDLVVLEARSATEIDAAFARLGQARAG